MSQITSFLRPICVAATAAIACILIIRFWGVEAVSWETIWKLLLSYLALMIGSFLVCYIYDSGRSADRE